MYFILLYPILIHDYTIIESSCTQANLVDLYPLTEAALVCEFHSILFTGYLFRATLWILNPFKGKKSPTIETCMTELN